MEYVYACRYLRHLRVASVVMWELHVVRVYISPEIQTYSSER